jgi:hypothetical protein
MVEHIVAENVNNVISNLPPFLSDDVHSTSCVIVTVWHARRAEISWKEVARRLSAVTGKRQQ